ncbi:tetratricopeptide repeat protein [Bizionia sp.]|uniref:tetratricopeptide repeat protein n=1 Tax=Bizionia sp. TaxID=1954480 RepID=UPI003A93AA1F
MKKIIFLFLILSQNYIVAQNDDEKNPLLNVSFEKFKKIIDETESDSLIVRGNGIQDLGRFINDKDISKIYYKSSIYAFTKCIDEETNLYEAYKERGRSLSYLKEYNLALRDFTKATEYNESDPIIFYLKALTKESIEDNYGAISDFKKAESLSEDNEFKSKALTKITHNQMFVGITDEILENLNKAINYWPKNALAYFIRGKYFILFEEKKQKGCLDLSRSNELGYPLAIDAIKENCKFKE